MKKAIAAVMAVLMSASLFGCGGGKTNGTTAAGTKDSGAAADSGDTIKIGAFFNFSGANADTGVLDGDGAQFAVDWINENGGIKSMGGKKLELVKGDTLSDSAQAKAVAERIISENPDMVAAVGAGGSGYTIAMGSVFE